MAELPLPKKYRDVPKWIWNLFRSRPKLIHYLYGGHHPLVYIISKLLGKTVLIHWIGSDVIQARSNRNWFYKRLRITAYRLVDQHLVDFQPLADELRLVGIQATLISLPPNIPVKKQDIFWPVDNVIFVYMPEEKQEFYGSEITFRLMKDLPDTHFLITGHNGKNAPQAPNIEYLGWTNDIEVVWKRIKVYLRLTKHDGLSHTVIEALSRAKHVVWSYEFPYCYQAQSFDAAKNALIKILSSNKPNLDGMHYVYEQYKFSKLTQDYKTIYTHFTARKK
ncbi:MAG: glycosyltransferase [Dehalococcoidales bacterium]|nr:glycosyltransferase [Dehalococcoidales bacterium]